MKPIDRASGHLDGLLLAVLASEPAHGYAVITELRLRSGGEFDMSEGSVYPALHRLERAGLLESRWAAGSTRRRRIYALTSSGAAALAAERTSWFRFVDAVQAVLGPRMVSA